MTIYSFSFMTHLMTLQWIQRMITPEVMMIRNEYLGYEVGVDLRENPSETMAFGHFYYGGVPVKFPLNPMSVSWLTLTMNI